MRRSTSPLIKSENLANNALTDTFGYHACNRKCIVTGGGVHMSHEDTHEYQELFTRQLEKLRQQKGVSQREMSLSLGQAAGYIAKLTNPKNDYLPRMINFFYICDYFNLHPKDFFDEGVKHPELINGIIMELYKLDETQLTHILAMIQDLTALHDKQKP